MQIDPVGNTFQTGVSLLDSHSESDRESDRKWRPSRQKARKIRKALRGIEEEFGEVSLRKLRRMTQEDAERPLLALPSVDLKSVRCMRRTKLFPSGSRTGDGTANKY